MTTPYTATAVAMAVVAAAATSDAAAIVACIAVGVALFMRWIASHRKVYLIDHAEFEAPAAYIGDVPRYREGLAQQLCTPEAIDFMVKLVQKNGLGPRTAAAPGMFAVPHDLSHTAARLELELVLFSCVDAALAKTGLRPSDIDILVTNCSLFNPIPSMASIVINKYRMRPDIESYHLGGMGCSANVIAVTLVRDLLRARPNSRALVLSTETITPNVYKGEDRSFLLANTLFRMGGAAQILTNRSDDLCAGRCRYELEHTVRTTNAANDEAYRCVFQEPDAAGHLGVRLDKNLVRCAGRTLKLHLAALAPCVLPISEKLRFLWDLAQRKLRPPRSIAPAAAPSAPVPTPTPASGSTPASAVDGGNTVGGPPTATAARSGSGAPPFVPNFRKAIQHFCIHAGGRAVIDGIKDGLQLTESDVAASRAVLRDYGNVSSASIWYEFAYVERGVASGRGETGCAVRRGDRIWQIAFGSGFKTNSSVWRKL